MKKSLFFICIVACCCLINTGQGIAQTTAVLRGKVFMPDSIKTLPGATVEDIGSGKKVSTDPSGLFSLEVPSTSGALRITHVGYKTLISSYNENAFLSELLLFMEMLPGELDNVEVSTGYQRLPRERSTGSFEILE